MRFSQIASPFFTALSKALSVLLLTVLLLHPAQAAQPLRIDYPDFWPFFTRTDEGQMTGFFYEIVTEALGRMEITATWAMYPWGRCQNNVQNGEADGMITVPTPERLIYAETHSTPFYHKELNIFTHKGHPKCDQIKKITSIDDILSLNLSVITYTGNGWNDRNIKSRGIKTYESPKLENVWPMLANNRGDIVIEWPEAAWPDIQKTKVTDNIVMTAATLESMPFHLLIRNDHPYAKRLPEFDKTIRDMMQDGTIDSIMRSYSPKFQQQD